jgi:metallo-beta-lactamase class B
MTNHYFILLLLAGFTLVCCKNSSDQKITDLNTKNHNTYGQSSDIETVYESSNLTIKRLSHKVYQHISYLNTFDFGKVGCNGMIAVNRDEVIIFDTPIDDISSIELIDFIHKELKSTIKGIIPTHFHEDCIGGIKEFERQEIPVYLLKQTANIIKERGISLSNSFTTFEDSITLNLKNEKVYAQYFGEGHTKDNIIGYFPEGETVFGGCLIKEKGAGKGYLADANINKWSETVQRIKLRYPTVKIIIPGHGKSGNIGLLDYTINLFKVK